jgi:hypothetical protein
VIDRPQKLGVPPEAAITPLLSVRLLTGVLGEPVEIVSPLAHSLVGPIVQNAPLAPVLGARHRRQRKEAGERDPERENAGMSCFENLHRR